MANSATITLTIDESAGNLTDILVDSNPQLMLSKLQNYIAGLSGGCKSASMSVVINDGNAVAASATLTLSSAAALDTAVVDEVTVTAVDKKEKTQVTALADVAGSLNSTYFNFSDALDAHLYYAWYDVDDTGVDPAPVGRTGIEINITAGDSADNVAAASRTAIDAAVSSYIVVSGATDKIVLRNKSVGATTNAADGTAGTGFTFTVQNAGGSVAATEFDIGIDDSEGASNLSDAINAQASLEGIASASSASNVVTVTSAVLGFIGNGIPLSATGGIAASDAYLSGGVDNTDITSYNFGR